ncbi:folate-binding protein YgfZ [Marinobacter sp.]|uniref:CAF17-like 4Fe-4S cluster assembly/insertion protein YgfZ n=1 Tax=Marinobacter sp. TaxID=50741 RepID=UPI0034A19B2D
MTDSANPRASQPLPSSAWTHDENQRILRITGPGTDKFLQGQFSQNLADVTAAFSPRAAAATPKGRAYCLTRLVRAGEDVLMSVPADLIDTISGQLRKYLMLFRGTSMDVLDDARIFGILGSTLATRLSPGQLDALNQPGASIVLGRHHLIRTESTAEGLDRFEYWQIGEPSAEHAPIFAADDDTAAINWQASEIAAGIAMLTDASFEAYVPQMLNWQHVGGVHFKKGCYTGQEVIARMHFLGQLKKSLFRFSAEGAASPPGTAVMAGEKPVGNVVNSVQLNDGSSEYLAVVRHNMVGTPLHLETTPDTPLQRLTLPYPVPEQDAAGGPDT